VVTVGVTGGFYVTLSGKELKNTGYIERNEGVSLPGLYMIIGIRLLAVTLSHLIGRSLV